MGEIQFAIEGKDAAEAAKSEWKKGRSGKTIEKAVIICSDGKRLLMKDAAVEDIQRFLESC
ncbi:MAG: hypothetical protein B6245_24195 [Desulfobacteraceae bacterium 4572_88]|nr:MAG: hypothetical protein B6245_24195 [Desulfobacteraceae bacterium 4572_88]